VDPHRWGLLREELTRRLRGYNGSVGVGGVFTAPSEASRSYDEAERALRIRQGSASSAGVSVHDEPGVSVHDELGIYRLLAAGDQGETEQFVREWLGGLLDYDAAHRTGLVATLWQYYECGGNYDQTAEALIICRSTVRYRLRRIRQLTGLDLGDVDNRAARRAPCSTEPARTLRFQGMQSRDLGVLQIHDPDPSRPAASLTPSNESFQPTRR
jgi:DNA-binding PucR family transcriptional regulator